MFFILSLAAERYLRHAGRLQPINRRRERVTAAFAILFAIVGQIGITLVAVFNTVDHPHTHLAMLTVFIVFVAFSVICTTYEFFVLDKEYKETHRLRISYFLKCVWLLFALIFAIAFVVLWARKLHVMAAVFEWTLSFFYGFYLFILSYDLYPAAKTEKGALLEQSLSRSVTQAISWLPGIQSTNDNNSIEKSEVDLEKEPRSLSSDLVVSDTPCPDTANKQQSTIKSPSHPFTPKCPPGSAADSYYKTSFDLTSPALTSGKLSVELQSPYSIGDLVFEKRSRMQ